MIQNDLNLNCNPRFHVFISLYAIRGIEDMEKEQEPENWTTLNPAFKDELIRLVKSKLVDANYRLYFYNYPSNSNLMYQFGFCLEYICNSALLENRNICYDEENIFNCIASNCEWILVQ